MKPFEIFVQVQCGLEDLAVKELEALGYSNYKRYKGGFELSGHWNTIFNLNLNSLLFSRILIRLNKFVSKTFYDFEKEIFKSDFEPFISHTDNICLRVNSKSSSLYHENALQERIHKFLEKKYQKKINLIGEADTPDTQLILLNAQHDQFVLSVDTTGKHLHKRGYNEFRADAPLRETVASAMLSGANIKNYDVLIDTFTGSGTIPIEACRLLNRVSSDKFRNFSFQAWKNFDENYYNEWRNQNNIVAPTNNTLQIFAHDIDEKNIHNAKNNILQSGFKDLILTSKKDFFTLSANDFTQDKKTLICANPPWGKRLFGVSLDKIIEKAVSLTKYTDIVFLIPDLYIKKIKKYKKLFSIHSGDIIVSAIQIL